MNEKLPEPHSWEAIERKSKVYSEIKELIEKAKEEYLENVRESVFINVLGPKDLERYYKLKKEYNALVY